MGKDIPTQEVDEQNVLSPKHKDKRKVVFVGLTALVVIGIIVGLVAYKQRKQDMRPPGVAVCSETILREASQALDPTQATKLQPIVVKIEALQDFDKDQNCLYIVLTYYINSDNPQLARATFNKLNGIYDPTLGFSPKLGLHTKDLAALEADVTFREITAKERQSNMTTFEDQP